jgi:hypothetical protein
MSKHTPGPWTLHPSKFDAGEIDIRGAYNKDIPATAWGSMDAETHMANARLIAAAPEMYEALHKAHEMLCKQEDALRAMGCDEPDAESAILTARAILAKVEGKV